jgi:hypothetical protein
MVFVVMTMLPLATYIFADPLQGAFKQRIGNYDVEMTTQPETPVVDDSPTDIMIRVAGVDGDDLVDVPISIRIEKDNTELQRTNPIIVQYGHHTHEFAFTEAGRYILYVDLNDFRYSGETLTFTFFINVGSAFDYVYIAASSVAAVAIGVFGVAVLMKGKKKKKEQKAGNK